MPGPAMQLQVPAGGDLKPALMVVRAQQIVVELGLLAISILSLLIHSFSRRRNLKRLLVIPCLFVVMTLISLSLTVTWLVKTASPKARGRGCAGRRPSPGCLDFSCDYLWDVVLTIVWALMLFPAAITRVLFTATLVLNCVLLAMFITSAVLSGLLRKRLRLEVGHFGVGQPYPQELALVQQQQQQQQARQVQLHTTDVEAQHAAPGSRAAAVL